MQRGEFLSIHEVKYRGRWGSSIAPSGRSSLMKYMIKKDIENMLWYDHTHQSGTRNKCQL
jgi:hypothetical protein